MDLRARLNGLGWRGGQRRGGGGGPATGSPDEPAADPRAGAEDGPAPGIPDEPAADPRAGAEDGPAPGGPDEPAADPRAEPPGPSVRERLARMGARPGATPIQAFDGVARRSGLETLPGARVVTRDSGAYLRIERMLEPAVGEAFRAWAALAEQHGDAVCRDLPSPAPDMQRALFLDTETTGLGGAGCLVFLIGGVHLEGDEARLTQFMMREPCEERAMMEDFMAFVAPFSALVSYNGRAFDVRALGDRCVMGGIAPMLRQLDEKPHIDLLYPSRRILGGAYDDCRLVTLERELLGRPRGADVDSRDIPKVYYQYLRTRRSGGVKQIISHNAHDLASLVMVGAKVMGMIADPGTVPGPQPSVGLGRLLIESGRSGRGEEALRAATASPVPETRYQARKQLALLLKRQGAWEGAAELWGLMREENVLKELHAHTELAKYHEHRRRDFRAALEVVEEALRLRQGRRLFCSPRDLEELRGRRERLEGKLEG